MNKNCCKFNALTNEDDFINGSGSSQLGFQNDLKQKLMQIFLLALIQVKHYSMGIIVFKLIIITFKKILNKLFLNCIHMLYIVI